jgi:hypothetical protein
MSPTSPRSSQELTMNPYEAHPAKIPSTDRYTDVPFYGRYFPQPDDFRPDPQHINSTTPESISYWLSVLKRCDPSVRLYENTDGGRDVFALGSVIVKSTHLKEKLEGRRAERDYSLADANEVEATALARRVLGSVRVPQIYFAGKVRVFICPVGLKTDLYKINGRPVLVQERIPGVGLTVAWQYLSQTENESFKEQARAVLEQLRTIKPPAHQGRSYVVPDPDPVSHRGIQELEQDILFSEDNDSDLGLMHNDFSQSNLHCG